MICSGLKIVVPLLWSNVVERTLACIYQNWQPSAMTLLTTTSVGRNRNSSEGSLRSPSSKRSWTSVGRNRNSSEGSLRSPSLQVLYLLHILFDESSLLFGRIVKPFKKALGRFLLSNKYKRRKAIGLGPLQKEGAEMMQAPFSLLTFQLLIKAQHRIVYLATIKKNSQKLRAILKIDRESFGVRTHVLR